MRPSLFLMILSQVLFWGTAFIYLHTAWFFNKGDTLPNAHIERLKKIMIVMFAIIGCYFAVNGLYWLLWDVGVLDNVQPIAFRIALTGVVFLVSLKFVVYIRGKM